MTITVAHVRPTIAIRAGISIPIVPRLLDDIVAHSPIAVGVIGSSLFRGLQMFCRDARRFGALTESTFRQPWHRGARTFILRCIMNWSNPPRGARPRHVAAGGDPASGRDR